jgi:hypothetical protein
VQRFLGSRSWLWALVLILIGLLLIRYRGSGAHPLHTLVPAAIPTASAYARDVVSASRCSHANSLQHSGLGDSCKTFAGIQGERIAASGRIVRRCTGASKVPSRAQDADCVRFTLTGPQGRGSLWVWLERRKSGWRIAAASAVTHA